MLVLKLTTNAVSHIINHLWQQLNEED